jgi:hypothetical protein
VFLGGKKNRGNVKEGSKKEEGGKTVGKWKLLKG